MNIYLFVDKKYFSADQIKKLKELGTLVFVSTNTNGYLKILKKDICEKVIVYDPDFAGWYFPDEILTTTQNIKAVFLGTTDVSYINNNLCHKLNIPILGIPRYASDSVAEYLVMYMFACAKKIPLQLKNKNKQDFSSTYLQMELKNKTVGIVGLGNIGLKIANICDGLGMKVVYWNRTKKQCNYDLVSLKKLFKICDVVYLCLSISDETKKLITDDLILSMKKNCIFISCTGKQLFNYNLIEHKLKNNELFGFGLEDPDKDIFTYSGNTMVTSEYAWFTKDAANLRNKKWFNNIVQFLCKHQNYSVSKFLDDCENDYKNEYAFCNIRKATKKDLPFIAELYKEQNWFGDDNSIKKMEKYHSQNRQKNLLLVAEYKHQIVGTLTASINRAYAFNCMEYMVFDYLVVKKEFRRKRIGTQLINYLKDYAKSHKLESIWVCSSIGRNKAHEFYDYVGFNDPVKGFRMVFIKE